MGYSGQITHGRRLGVEHSKCGDLPLSYGLGQPVEIDVRGSLPRLARGLSGEMVGQVRLEGGQLRCQSTTLSPVGPADCKPFLGTIENEPCARGLESAGVLE